VDGRLAPDAPERCGGEVQEAARIALHSTHLSFPHPATGELLVFDLAPPAEFWALGGLAADSWAGSFIDR
jgi:hypothetical protein